jgi:hypothetical protein
MLVAEDGVDITQSILTLNHTVLLDALSGINLINSQEVQVPEAQL